MVLNNSVISLTVGKGFVSGPSVSHSSELSIRDRLNLVKNSPLNTLSARRCGERTIVVIESIKVKTFKEASNSQLVIEHNIT